MEESWILSIKEENDNVNNSYYFYDEIISNDFENDTIGKDKSLSVLLVSTIQMKYFPEANELLKQTEILELKPTANQITLNYLLGKSYQNDD